MDSIDTADLDGRHVRSFSERELDGLARSFASAAPFPHVVIDDLLLDAATVAASFPDPSWEGWVRYDGNEYQAGKMICSAVELLPAPIAAVVRECHDPAFLRSLERITGVAKLIPDPYLNGGGMHCSEAGGILQPHTDFHHYERLGLYRRLNVLLYLNEAWSEADGGALELFEDADATVVAATVVPTLGRCVVFRTDDRSVHGFTTPVRGPEPRRSIALYYYTAAEAPEYSGDTTTYWRRHAKARGIGALRLRAYRALLFVARGVAFVAHRVNPSRMSDPTRRSQEPRP